MLKTAVAVTAGKLSAQLIQVFKVGSGTSLPGKIASKLESDLLQKLGRQVRQKTVAITGTNGKSTTAGLLDAFIEEAGYRVVHNQLGANMIPGITAALLQKTSLLGHLDSDYGVLEVDEASMPAFSKSIKQDLTLVTNLFRDQLDRYGELDTTARMIREGITHSGGYLALNADDPIVTSIGRHFPEDRVFYYGVESIDYPNAPNLDFPVGFPKEVTDCPACQSALHYSKVFYGHLGHYDCERCGFTRPTPWLKADEIRITAEESLVQINADGERLSPLTLHLPGLFNAYNLIAATTAAHWLNLPKSVYEQGVSSYHSIFGRAEKKVIEGKPVMILLIKNPIGATEVLKVVATAPNRRLVIMINDNYADGRDISWLWDAPFEMLAGVDKPVWVSGHRAEDMAVRLKYAGVPEDKIQTEPDILKAFHQAVTETTTEETLYVLPTYTALLQLSQHLKSR